jgi:GNAT superfamily N-acetyltransferase
MNNIFVRLATIIDLDEIRKLTDLELRNAGMGFVGTNQIRTEIYKKTVWVAQDGPEIIGVRIGARTIYNLVVRESHRKIGVGSKLIQVFEPEQIRVKAIPVGHLSNEQRSSFVDPRPFYEKLGYKFIGWLKAKNFWAGSKGKKRIYYSESDKAHIALYEHHNPRQKKLW